MPESQDILPDEFVGLVFRVRLRTFLGGLGIVVVLRLLDAAPTSLVLIVGLGCLMAWVQRRTMSTFRAYVFDLGFAVGLAITITSPLSLVMVVGWAAAIGLSDTERTSTIPIAAGVAAAISTFFLESQAGLVGRLGPMEWASIVLVAMVAITFEIIFRAVGDLLGAREIELRDFFERVPVALVRTDGSGTLLQANPEAARMFGVEAARYAPDSFLDASSRARLLERLAEDGSVMDFETEISVGPDRVFPALIAANAVPNPDGSLRFIEAGVLDLSSLHEARSGRERLARVVESTSDMIALADPDGTIVFANPAALSWRRSFFPGNPARSLGQIIPEATVHEIQEEFARRGEWSGDIEIATDSEARRLLSLSLYLIEGEESTAIIATDTTDAAATARKLEELVAAKDEFVAAVSHEIRTPLTAVVGLASELYDHAHLFDEDMRTEMMGLIVEQSREAADIVEDLLVAARIDTDSIVIASETVDLARISGILLDSLPKLETTAESVTAELEGMCVGDPRRIRQILRNLLTNALRYGGPNIEIRSRVEGEALLVEVIDDGNGVAPERVDAIFEPFERAHTIGTQPSSVGIGLSISRQLARRMAGEVSYRRIGDRSVFTLCLPTALEPAHLTG